MVMNVEVEALSHSSVKVFWDEIQSDVPTITNYTMYYGLKEGDEREKNQLFLSVPRTRDFVVVDNLSTEYQFQVAATAEANGETIIGQRSEVQTLEVVVLLLSSKCIRSYGYRCRTNNIANTIRIHGVKIEFITTVLCKKNFAPCS